MVVLRAPRTSGFVILGLYQDMGVLLKLYSRVAHSLVSWEQE